jgi:hypothetical protein
MHHKLLEQQEQIKSKTNIWEEIIKIRDKISEIETKNTIQRINEMESWLFEKISKIDKHLPILTRRKREKTQTDKIKDK